MKLLLALLIWSQDIYPSNVAPASRSSLPAPSSLNANASATASQSSATAADVKGAAARRAAYGTVSERSGAVGQATGMPSELARITAEYVPYPEMPEDIARVLINLREHPYDVPRQKRGEPTAVYQWLQDDPSNVNATYTHKNGIYKPSLLIMAIQAYKASDSLGRYENNENPIELLRYILSLNPDVRYRTPVPKPDRYRQVDFTMPPTALSAICFMDPKVFYDYATDGEDVIRTQQAKERHAEFAHKIVDLLIEQGAPLTAIEAELKQLLADREFESSLYNSAHYGASGQSRLYFVTAEVLAYLHDIQAAAGLEAEMKSLEFPNELAGMGAGYIAKQPKKDNQKPKGSGR